MIMIELVAEYESLCARINERRRTLQVGNKDDVRLNRLRKDALEKARQLQEIMAAQIYGLEKDLGE